MDYEVVKEGSTRLKEPVSETPSKKDEVFYNPNMELARDLSVAFVKTVEVEGFCDLLAASGARGIRIANEAGIPVHLNDANPNAVDLIKENAGLNDVDVEVENLNHRVFLADKRFDFIDVDPFGPPVRYMGDVFASTTNQGYVSVTATDTSALSGSYPNACRRKYGAFSLRTDYYDELGLRILLGYLAQTALSYGYGVDFLFSHATRHYFRTYLKVDWSGGKVDETLDNLEYIQHCFNCLKRRYGGLHELKEKCGCGEKLRSAGPLWTGKYAEPSTCSDLKDELMRGSYRRKGDAVELVEKVKGEQEIMLPYYNLHKVYKKLGVSALKTKTVMDKIWDAGCSAIKTHFNPVGLKTDYWPMDGLVD